MSVCTGFIQRTRIYESLILTIHIWSELLSWTKEDLWVLQGKKQCADHDSNPQSDTLCANEWNSKTALTSTEPTKIAPRARRVIALKVKKVISNKSYLTLATVHVHESTIRRTLNNNGVLGMAARRNRALSKKNTAAYLQFANHEDKPEGCWNNVCGWM